MHENNQHGSVQKLESCNFLPHFFSQCLKVMEILYVYSTSRICITICLLQKENMFFNIFIVSA